MAITAQAVQTLTTLELQLPTQPLAFGRLGALGLGRLLRKALKFPRLILWQRVLKMLSNIFL